MPDKIFQKEIELTDNQSLVIKNSNGSIELIASQGHTLHIEAKIGSDDQRSVDARDVVVEETPDQVTVRIEPTGAKRLRGWKFGGESVRVDFFIKAPQRVSITARTINGNIKSLGLNSLEELKSMNGELEVVECSGKPILSTMNGRIVARSCSFGQLEAKTMNGPLSVETQINPNGCYYLKSTHGDLEFLVPQNSNAFIEAKSMQGEIDCQLQLRDLKRKGIWFSGTMGTGGAKVGLKSMSGKITIAEFRGTNPLEQEEELISKMLKEGRITQDEASKLKEAIFGQEGT